MANLKSYICEFFATFALIFIGAGAVLSGNDILGVALAHGLVLMAMIYAVSNISGAHINPAVTVAMLVTNKIKAGKAIMYIVFQLAGAVVGALFLSMIFSNAPVNLQLDTPMLGSNVSFWSGVFVEFILTFLLVFIIFGTAVEKKADKGVYGAAIGVVLIFDILVGGNLTGAAMNPARAFGPAFVSGFWVNHLVYWIGPIIGAVLAGLIWQRFLTDEKTN